MLYKRNYPNSCPLFRKLSFEKVKANFRVDFAPFYNIRSVLLSFFVFVTKCLDKHFWTRLMILRGYFFIKVPQINRSRLLALIDCICGTEICGYIVLQKNREAFY